MNRALVAAVVVGLLGSLAPERASAQDSESADALFREARRLMGAGRYDEACEKFRASNNAEASVGALLNLGECELKRDDPAAAWSAFRRAELLARATDDRDRGRFAKRRMDAVAKRLGFVTVIIPPRWRTAPNLEVKLDGDVLAPGSLGPPLPVEPGVHRIAASADGARPFEVDVQVEIDPAPVAVDVELVEVAKPAEPRPVEPPDGRGTQRIIGISMTAAGGLALAVSITLGAAARSQWNDVKDCREVPPCSDEDIDGSDSAKTKADIATGFFIAGALIAGAGIAVWATASRGGSDEEKGAAEPGVTVVPVVDGESFGVAASGRF